MVRDISVGGVDAFARTGRIIRKMSSSYVLRILTGDHSNSLTLFLLLPHRLQVKKRNKINTPSILLKLFNS